MTKLSVFVVNDSRLYTCRAFYPVSSLFQRHSQNFDPGIQQRNFCFSLHQSATEPAEFRATQAERLISLTARIKTITRQPRGLSFFSENPGVSGELF